MEKNLLNYFQSINKGFIHPKGEIATQLLANELELKKGDVVLELGHGTGGSLVFMHSVNSQIQLYGVEASELMHQKAHSRLKFCGLNNQITLSLLNEHNKIQYPDHFFDKVYVESVLAIQPGKKLENMIEELNRVLKPNGILCINELIWGEKTSLKQIEATNAFVLEQFGLIQANANYPYLKDWKGLFEHKNFNLLNVFNIDHLEEKSSNQGGINRFKSSVFTFFGKLNGKLNGKKRKEAAKFYAEMAKVDDQIDVKAYILKFQKKGNRLD